MLLPVEASDYIVVKTTDISNPDLAGSTVPKYTNRTKWPDL